MSRVPFAVGFVCCLVGLLAAPLGAQQNPHGQVPVSGLLDAYLVLIRDPLVQRELRVSDPQRRAIEAVTDELDITLWTLRNQPPETAAEGFRSLIAQAEARMEPILSAAQRQRLAQIRLSAAGLPVLLREDVATRLQLNADQRSRIEAALQEAGAAADTARAKANGRPTPGKPVPAARDVSQRVAAILSREQLATVRELLGPAIDGSRLGYVKFKAPELDGADGWINTEPLTMEQLKGKVVALHFWTFG